VTHLISASDMSPGDLARVKRMIEDAQAPKGETT
jgi:hypothetical protein